MCSERFELPLLPQAAISSLRVHPVSSRGCKVAALPLSDNQIHLGLTGGNALLDSCCFRTDDLRACRWCDGNGFLHGDCSLLVWGDQRATAGFNNLELCSGARCCCWLRMASLSRGHSYSTSSNGRRAYVVTMSIGPPGEKKNSKRPPPFHFAVSTVTWRLFEKRRGMEVSKRGFEGAPGSFPSAFSGRRWCYTRVNVHVL